jgi:hypothetical protein
MFQKSRIAGLTQRALLFQKEGVPLKHSEIDYVSSSLGVVFSEDFVDINVIYDYAYLGRFDFYSFYYKGASGVTKKTRTFREVINLPHRYVLLSDMGDAGAVFLETQDTPEKPSPVIWCDQEDIDRLCREEPLIYNPTVWPSFTDFFEYLVEQEEAKGKE